MTGKPSGEKSRESLSHDWHPLHGSDNKWAWQRLPLPSSISFLGGDFTLLYGGWHADSGDPTGSRTWAWCLTAADSCLVKANFTVKCVFCLGIGNYRGRTNANKIPVQGRSFLRDSPARKPWVSGVCLQLLFWGNLWAIFKRAFGEDRGSLGAIWRMLALGRYCFIILIRSRVNAGPTTEALDNLGQVTLNFWASVFLPRSYKQ